MSDSYSEQTKGLLFPEVWRVVLDLTVLLSTINIFSGVCSPPTHVVKESTPVNCPLASTCEAWCVLKTFKKLTPTLKGSRINVCGFHVFINWILNLQVSCILFTKEPSISGMLGPTSDIPVLGDSFSHPLWGYREIVITTGKYKLLRHSHWYLYCWFPRTVTNGWYFKNPQEI